MIAVAIVMIVMMFFLVVLKGDVGALGALNFWHFVKYDHGEASVLEALSFCYIASPWDNGDVPVRL